MRPRVTWAVMLLIVHLCGYGHVLGAASYSHEHRTRWRPVPGTSFQDELWTPVDITVPAEVYILDLFTTDERLVSALHAKGRRAVCYVDVGTFETWRPDAGDFPVSVVGKPNVDWPGEYYLDIRSPAIRPIIGARFDQCRNKGFDAIEPDNITTSLQTNGPTPSGFPITAADQLAYNTWLAEQAHARGLAIAEKNNYRMVEQLVTMYDFAISEDCFFYHGCDAYLPFIRAGKAVFDIEYTLPPAEFCPQSNAMNFDSIHKNRSLDAYRIACR